MQHVPQIRIFLSSPGDVNDERTIARQLIEDLPYRPLLRDKIAVRIIAWDKVGAGTALRANLKPQEAINKGLPRPSQCDINFVIFWSRLGTEFTDEAGKRWESGTHWELHDALFNAPHNRTVIYRSHIKPKSLDDPFSPDFDGNKVQWDRLTRFLSSDLFYKDGQIQRSITQYHTLDEFRTKLATDLEEFVAEILAEQETTPAPRVELPLPAIEQVIEVKDELWPGSPFPGLRAFEEADAPIFFGRGRETDDLIRGVETNCFTAVVAASGSGKSSLVAAGLIPRLRAGAIAASGMNSKDWRFVRFKPGTDPEGGPLAALFSALCAAFPEHAVSPFMQPQEKRVFLESIGADPQALVEIGNALLKEAGALDWAEILFFVDQFEELFTVVKKGDRAPFVALLEAIQKSKRLRCVVTMRSDFYADCLELPVLATLLKEATYPLAVPIAGALYEMITRPAERAGLTWDDGLPGRILDDTGSEAGALALMAYALDELYKASHSRDDKRLTFADYDAIGKVEGAIGKRAETVFAGLKLPDKDRLLQRVFRELVTVNPTTGAATRQRAALGTFNHDEMALIRALADKDARLLVTYDDTVEVAHEAVFRSWKRLIIWIAGAQEDLILLRQVRTAAEEWAHHDQPDYLRWPAERLKPVYEMLRRQEPSLNEVERDFIEPEQERLLREIDNIATDHQHRRWIGERLAMVGDTRSGIGVDENGLPQIDWLPVEKGGEIEIETQIFTVLPFYVAKYLVTYAQFQSFLDAPDGFTDERWWQGFPPQYVRQEMAPATQEYGNYPRDTVSWYQAIAFTRWLNAKYQVHDMFRQFPAGGWELRLPTEWEWQWMAQNGTETRSYPWGRWDEHPRANTKEAGIGDRSTAVGIYPDGAASCGAVDVAGNLWEWCQNDYHDLTMTNGYANSERKVLRGGSFSFEQYDTACAFRDPFAPHLRSNPVGLRVVVGPLLRP